MRLDLLGPFAAVYFGGFPLLPQPGALLPEISSPFSGIQRKCNRGVASTVVSYAGEGEVRHLAGRKLRRSRSLQAGNAAAERLKYQPPAALWRDWLPLIASSLFVASLQTF